MKEIEKNWLVEWMEYRLELILRALEEENRLSQRISAPVHEDPSRQSAA